MENYKNVLQDIRDQLNAEAESIQIILTGIDNDIYSTVDACPNACEMWKAIERLKQEWQRFVTLVKQSQELKTVSYHKLYDILKQHQNEVNEIRAERLARTANPLALAAQQQPPLTLDLGYWSLMRRSLLRLSAIVFFTLKEDLIYATEFKIQEMRLAGHDDEMWKEFVVMVAMDLVHLLLLLDLLVGCSLPIQLCHLLGRIVSWLLSQQATRNRGKAIVNSFAPTYDQEPAMVTKDDEMSKEKEIDKLMALFSLSFKKIYKPTNNNIRTSSNTSRANQDNSPRINRGTRYENQRAVNVAGSRENVGTLVVQKSGIQCYNCKEYGHLLRECQKPKRAKDATYHKEKMLLCKQEEAGV
ncbi:retrovirus-related pol polyprotein from transposon TNT 1-94 [Tanacetum coccineum]